MCPLQFTIANYFQVESRRLATPSGGYLLTPTVEHIASAMNNKASAWKKSPGRMTKHRVQKAFNHLEKLGYLKTKQQRMINENGNYVAMPALRVLTKKFFIELGGEDLWKRVQHAGQAKLDKMKVLLNTVGMTLRDYVAPRLCLSPKQAHAQKANPWFYTEVDEDRLKRRSKRYLDYKADILFQLAAKYFLDDPPVRWSLEKIEAVARSQTDKRFGIAF